MANPIFRMGEALRPVLLRLFPKALLRQIKGKMLARSFRAMTARAPYERGAYPQGVNLIGYLQAQMGLGQGARLFARALEKTGLPAALLSVRGGNPAAHGDDEFADRLADFAAYSCNLIHINPEQLPLLSSLLPASTWSKRCNIGIWLWELEDFPTEWIPAFAACDEIWAPSTWGAKALRKVSPVPVHTVPYGVTCEADASIDRAHFGLAEGITLFLCMYDVNSAMQRKNPLGAIAAFKLAFAPNRADVGLVIKVNNADEAELALIRAETAGYSHVYILDRVLSKREVGSLIACCDVFVSLHRSEGFGLVCAEAMLLGKPCVATNYSANTDFMDASCACPVDYELVTIARGSGVYRAGGRWAEPDIAHCASYLKRLCEDKAYYDAIAKAGQARIRADFSPQACADAINNRLKQVL